MGGATGLDYAGVLAHLRQCGYKGKTRRTLYNGIRAAESGTLAGWAAKRAAEQKP